MELMMDVWVKSLVRGGRREKRDVRPHLCTKRRPMNPMMEAQSCPGLGTTRVRHSVYRNKMDKEEFLNRLFKWHAQGSAHMFQRNIIIVLNSIWALSVKNRGKKKKKYRLNNNYTKKKSCFIFFFVRHNTRMPITQIRKVYVWRRYSVYIWKMQKQELYLTKERERHQAN